MDERLDEVIRLVKQFSFDDAHAIFLSFMEDLLPQLDSEGQAQAGQLLALYEDAFLNKDVIRICDIVRYGFES